MPQADSAATAAPAPGPRATLGRSQRLTRADDFRLIFDTGRSAPGRYLVLWSLARPEGARRLGVIASRRNFRRAVWRNRARRLLREAFRLNRHRLRTDVDVLLVARQAIRGARRQDVEKDLLIVARKAGLLPPAAGSAR